MKKWRNKITGEINEFMVHKRIEDSEDGNPVYAPFDGNIDDWEDYEKSEEHWAIDQFGEPINVSGLSSLQLEKLHRLGNDFPSEKATIKAIEKLEAWKRLKDNGFKFEGIENRSPRIKFYQGRSYETEPQCIQAGVDLDLLFGGEE